jgi:single-strand DNA-binding protein
MSFGLSKAQIIGHTGRDAEMRFTPNGTAVTQFTVAVNRRSRNSNSGGEDETDWYRIVCFGRQAELADQMVRKGMRIYVDGRLQIRQYTTNEGENRTSVEIVANDFVLLTPRDEAQQMGERGGQGPSDEEFDDLPF